MIYSLHVQLAVRSVLLSGSGWLIVQHFLIQSIQGFLFFGVGAKMLNHIQVEIIPAGYTPVFAAQIPFFEVYTCDNIVFTEFVFF